VAGFSQPHENVERDPHIFPYIFGCRFMRRQTTHHDRDTKKLG